MLATRQARDPRRGGQGGATQLLRRFRKFAGVQANPDCQFEASNGRQVGDTLLHGNRRPAGLFGAGEHRQEFVPGDLDRAPLLGIDRAGHPLQALVDRLHGFGFGQLFVAGCTARDIGQQHELYLRGGAHRGVESVSDVGKGAIPGKAGYCRLIGITPLIGISGASKAMSPSSTGVSRVRPRKSNRSRSARCEGTTFCMAVNTASVRPG